MTRDGASDTGGVAGRAAPESKSAVAVAGPEEAVVVAVPGSAREAAEQPSPARAGAKSAGTVRIAAGQGFWGDWQEAPKLQLRSGPIDYLILDYLAEITMSIMQKQKERKPGTGYARDFVLLMSDLVEDLIGKGVRVVTNAGGVNPAACRAELGFAFADKSLPRRPRVAVVTGDDIMESLDDLIAAGHDFRNMETGEPLSTVRGRVVAANAYLGAEPLVEAFRQGADIVVTGRSTDTALTYAPIIHEFSWEADDWDRLACGVVAGHLNECGCQASGGNSLVDWREIDLAVPGYPIIEAQEDGAFIVTKHPELGGRVTRSTVAEQLLYELGDPRDYITPDVTADFSSVTLDEVGEDRVRVAGAAGRPRTDSLKVSIAYRDGYKAVGSLVYAWPDALDKARRADEILRGRLAYLGLDFDEIRTEYVGAGACHGPLAGAPPDDLPEVMLRVGVRGPDRRAVTLFTREIAPLVLAGPPTVTGFAGGRPRVQEVIAYWPALVDRDIVERRVRVETMEL